MRNIKFRGKINREWVYGLLLKSDKDDEYQYLIQSENEKCKCCGKELVKYFTTDEKTIGQYTGLKDKNGKEIYEGDIVKVFTNKEWRIGKIIYEHSEFTIDVTNNKDLKYGRTSIIENLTEVIGNIYDNPELLEEGE